jgi:hypothetical protein
MTDFCPDGCVPELEAMFRAAGYWFPKEWAALWEATAPQSATKPDNNFDAVVRAFSQSPIPAAWQDDAWRHEFRDVWSQTANRLRNFAHQGTLTICYFDNNGRQVLPRNFWPTPAADGVLETGIYWPFGRPNARYEQRPSYPLFVEQSELDALLSEQPAKKRPFPRSKMPELVSALRALDHLNREEQRKALRTSPEFGQYRLIDRVLREAEKQVPRDAGWKRPRPEQ